MVLSLFFKSLDSAIFFSSDGASNPWALDQSHTYWPSGSELCHYNGRIPAMNKELQNKDCTPLTRHLKKKKLTKIQVPPVSAMAEGPQSPHVTFRRLLTHCAGFGWDKANFLTVANMRVI